MDECKYCDKFISEKDQIFQCPNCMNNFHMNCLKERIIETETVMGRMRKYKTNYYKCLICSKEVRNLKIKPY